MSGRLVAAMLAGLTAVAACTGDASPEAQEPVPSQPSTTRAEPPDPSADDAEPSTPVPTSPVDKQYDEPLVFAFDIHREPVRLTEQQARSILRRDLTSWQQLGQPGGQIVV